ncbi:hypothetical protein F5Y16DRAFT_414248 [Xylariaceae sp. FL0255]|nr:hypothetical protein F5Y16DRAFT_414248 [Xylariaceae sp. FL0255]
MTTANPNNNAAARRSFNPPKEHWREAREIVHDIFKLKPNNLDLVATELAPVFGFGPESNTDVVARMKAQTVFRCPALQDALDDFSTNYLRHRWDMPVANWNGGALQHVHYHKENPASFNYLARCLVEEDEGSREKVDIYYARFLWKILQEIRHPTVKTHLFYWLQDADDDAVCWVFFHVLMYLQLQQMQINRTEAPFRVVVAHYLAKWTGLL